VQDVNGFRIADRVDGTPCAAFLIRDNFKHGPSAKTSQRLCRWIGFTLLRSIKGLAEVAPNFGGKLRRSLRLEPTQITGRSDLSIIHKYV
jgi:hypothetical protein